MLKVKDCITREVITANRGTPLKDIIKFFKENNFHILPVVNGDNDNNLVGKISLTLSMNCLVQSLQSLHL